MSEHEDAITKAIRRADAFTNAATALQDAPMREPGGSGRTVPPPVTRPDDVRGG
jgi:hypothetical protein